jgi:hypothetical protein
MRSALRRSALLVSVWLHLRGRSHETHRWSIAACRVLPRRRPGRRRKSRSANRTWWCRTGSRRKREEIEKATGYKVNWKQFGGGGEVIKAMASGAVQIGEVGSAGIAAAVSRGEPLELFWILDDIGSRKRWSRRTAPASTRSPT